VSNGLRTNGSGADKCRARVRTQAHAGNSESSGLIRQATIPGAARNRRHHPVIVRTLNGTTSDD